MKRVCRNCKWFYTNESMDDLYICVNGNSEMFASYTGICCENECENFESEFDYDFDDEYDDECDDEESE